MGVLQKLLRSGIFYIFRLDHLPVIIFRWDIFFDDHSFGYSRVFSAFLRRLLVVKWEVGESGRNGWEILPWEISPTGRNLPLPGWKKKSVSPHH